MSTPFGCNQSARDLRRLVVATLDTVMFFSNCHSFSAEPKESKGPTGRISRFGPKGPGHRVVSPDDLTLPGFAGDCANLACDSPQSEHRLLAHELVQVSSIRLAVSEPRCSVLPRTLETSVGGLARRGSHALKNRFSRAFVIHCSPFFSRRGEMLRRLPS